MFFKQKTLLPSSDANWQQFFTKQTEPKNISEVLKWFFFERKLLDDWDETLNKKTVLQWFLKLYACRILPILFVSWILLTGMVVHFDLPFHYPSFFKDEIMNQWKLLTNITQKFEYLLNILKFNLFVGLFIHLSMLLFFSWFKKNSLFFVLFLSYTLGEAILVNLFWISYSGYNKTIPINWGDLMRFCYLISAWMGIFSGIMRAHPYLSYKQNAKEYNYGLILSIFILFSGFTGIFVGFLKGILISCSLSGIFTAHHLGYFLGFYQCWHYPIDKWEDWFSTITFTKNPYLNNDGIRLPLPRVKQQLLILATKEPLIAINFSAFLFKYRPLQRDLAFAIFHEVITQDWLDCNKLNAVQISENTIDFLKPSNTRSDKYLPSEIWHKRLIDWHNTLIQYEQTANLHLQKDLLKNCEDALNSWILQQEREEFERRLSYTKVLQHWQKLLKQQQQTIQQNIDLIAPISNPYSAGIALSPENRRNHSLFLERTDLKDEIAQKIWTAEAMPMLLIWGQRRTGKTTLLNFLPNLLGARMDIVKIDAQGWSGANVATFLNDFHEKIIAQLKLNVKKQDLPLDALQAWSAMEWTLENHVCSRKRRLMLAIDECEKLHEMLSEQPEVGGHLLGRMRSFSQKQHQVVLLFLSGIMFSDFEAPNWGNYFVHTHLFRVPYLSEKGSLQLIERPVTGFELKYEVGVSFEIWRRTQGHPHLLHFVCSELVDYANRNAISRIQASDLEKVIAEKILVHGVQPFSVFWTEFCEKPAIRQAVLDIVYERQIDSNTQPIKLLHAYEFLSYSEGKIILRVPLFAEWVRKFG